MFRGEGAGRTAARVQAVEALGPRIPEETEQVAADSAARRLGQAEHGVRRDGGVHGAAPGAQDLQALLGGPALQVGPGLAGQDMLGCGDAAPLSSREVIEVKPKV